MNSARLLLTLVLSGAPGVALAQFDPAITAVADAGLFGDEYTAFEVVGGPYSGGPGETFKADFTGRASAFGPGFNFLDANASVGPQGGLGPVWEAGATSPDFFTAAVEASFGSVGMGARLNLDSDVGALLETVPDTVGSMTFGGSVGSLTDDVLTFGATGVAAGTPITVSFAWEYTGTWTYEENSVWVSPQSAGGRTFVTLGTFPVGGTAMFAEALVTFDALSGDVDVSSSFETAADLTRLGDAFTVQGVSTLTFLAGEATPFLLSLNVEADILFAELTSETPVTASALATAIANGQRHTLTLDAGDTFVFTGIAGAQVDGIEINPADLNLASASGFNYLVGVPEPAHYAALLGLIALGYAVWRRRG